MSTEKPSFIHYLPEDSIYWKVGFFPKAFLFLCASFFSLFNTNIYANFCIALPVLFLILRTGFHKNNKKPFLLLTSAIVVFSIFWIFFSHVEGNATYITFLWGSYITNETIHLLLLSIGKWMVIVLFGLFFMIITSEEELINSFISAGAPNRLIFTVTIAFNTVGFCIRDIEKIEYALESRGFGVGNGIIKKIKKIFYIGIVLFLSNFKKIENLNSSYVLRENRYEGADNS